MTKNVFASLDYTRTPWNFVHINKVIESEFEGALFFSLLDCWKVFLVIPSHKNVAENLEAEKHSFCFQKADR